MQNSLRKFWMHSDCCRDVEVAVTSGWFSDIEKGVPSPILFYSHVASVGCFKSTLSQKK